MHILAIFFVLAALGLAFFVIGGMLFAHHKRIFTALTVHEEKTDSSVIFWHGQTPGMPISRRFISDSSLSLAA
jgi:hypothetical protein